MFSAIISTALAKIMFAASGMMLADTALGRIQPVMDAPTLAVPEHPQTPKDNRVVFRDVSFTYDGAQSPALSHVSFTAEPGETVALVGPSGGGKTTAAIEFRRTHRNVFYILCSEDMKRSDFVREIAKQVGAPTDSTSNLRDMLDYALGMIGFLQNPLLIFDEGDKLTDCVLNYFISIYNRLEGRAGIVFMSTDYIKRRVDNGLRYNKKGLQGN